eukprot:3956291-Pyramimonas_sp.AAC.1
MGRAPAPPLQHMIKDNVANIYKDRSATHRGSAWAALQAPLPLGTASGVRQMLGATIKSAASEQRPKSHGI